MNSKAWLVYALVTVAFWGVWGVFAGLPASHGFPDTLIYCVWALTMIPPAIFALRRERWRVPTDGRAVLYGSLIGFLGAGGQMLLFNAVKTGPAYLVFPLISLSPMVTVLLSFSILRERTTWLGGIGILLALISLPLFDYSGGSEPSTFGQLWFLQALGVLVAWGLQAFFMKLANATMSAESIFFYMMITGLLLIPVALVLTDFSSPINWGVQGPYLAAVTQILNSVGALCLVYAFRYGKAIVVAPLANAGAPLVTALLSMALLGAVPSGYKLAGVALAVVSAVLLAIEPEPVAPVTRAPLPE